MFSSHTFNAEAHHSAHTPCPFPFIPVTVSVSLSEQNSVIKPRQSSPEQSEDVAKAHNVLQIYRLVFDLLGPCSVGRIQTHTGTHTEK